MSSPNKLEDSFDIFVSMQCNFSYNIAQEIFPGDVTHFWNKWLSSQDNILTFLNTLDKFNRRKMLDWGITLVS